MKTVLLQIAPEGGGMSTFLMFGLIIVVFYFFMIRPQAKKAKEMKQFREATQKGDRVVTIGGIHGKIVDVKETTLTIEVEGGMKMKVEKNAISQEFSSNNLDQQEQGK